MFEKCGLRDIFYRIWKCKWWVLGVTVFFFLMGIILSAGNRDADDPLSLTAEANGRWAASASYLVASDPSAADNKNGDGIESADLSLAHTYAEILHADFSAEKIMDRLLQKYTMDELVSGLFWDVTADTVSPFAFRNTYFADVLEPAPIVNFYVYAKDETLARDFIEECTAVFESIADVVPGSSVKKIDGVVAYEYLDAAVPGSEKETGLNKIAFLMPVFGFVMSLLIVFFLAIFRPTINRKSDFSFYDVPVIGELSVLKDKTGDTYEK